MASAEEVQLAVRAGADAVGFVGPTGDAARAGNARRRRASIGVDRRVRALRLVRPFGVDLCSGVRTDRRLDASKLDAFIEAVRQADLG